MKASIHIVIVALGAFLLMLILAISSEHSQYSPSLLGMPKQLVLGIGISLVVVIVTAAEAYRLQSKKNKQDKDME